MKSQAARNRTIPPQSARATPEAGAINFESLGGGVIWERLTAQPDDAVEFLHVVYRPGAESCPPDQLFRHGGKEYAYVQSGRLGLQIGFENYELEAGDSASFSAQMPHRLWAVGSEPAVAIWVAINRTDDRRIAGER